mmetsp:Transcript_9785/g.23933  ORF Transcript_9785/g.23933 Transcript_9785/m.23933 type:complete len:106 (+) Transcript_9785:300-617(+)
MSNPTPRSTPTPAPTEKGHKDEEETNEKARKAAVSSVLRSTQSQWSVKYMNHRPVWGLISRRRIFMAVLRSMGNQRSLNAQKRKSYAGRESVWSKFETHVTRYST